METQQRKFHANYWRYTPPSNIPLWLLNRWSPIVQTHLPSQITSLVFAPKMDSTSFSPFIMQYKTFRSQQHNHLLGCLRASFLTLGGWWSRGSSRVDQQNPKASTYQYLVEDRRRSYPRCHKNHIDHLVLCWMWRDKEYTETIHDFIHSFHFINTILIINH